MFKTDEELDTVRSLVHRMVERALALDGTCKASQDNWTPFEVLNCNFSFFFQVQANTESG
jgi:hypothetical protein